jgi:endogenous inhibitor of DNA gyrase (YacG/DUF329 family)
VSHRAFRDRGDGYCAHCGRTLGWHAGRSCFTGDEGGLPAPAARVAADNVAAIEGRCAICGRELAWTGRGRHPITCSPAHKQELHRRRRRRRHGELTDAERGA